MLFSTANMHQVPTLSTWSERSKCCADIRSGIKHGLKFDRYSMFLDLLERYPPSITFILYRLGNQRDQICLLLLDLGYTGERCIHRLLCVWTRSREDSSGIIEQHTLEKADYSSVFACTDNDRVGTINRVCWLLPLQYLAYVA